MLGLDPAVSSMLRENVTTEPRWCCVKQMSEMRIPRQQDKPNCFRSVLKFLIWLLQVDYLYIVDLACELLCLYFSGLHTYNCTASGNIMEESNRQSSTENSYLHIQHLSVVYLKYRIPVCSSSASQQSSTIYKPPSSSESLHIIYYDSSIGFNNLYNWIYLCTVPISKFFSQVSQKDLSIDV